MDFTFDPRDLIGPPFRSCPRCGKQSFGVLSIHGASYARRCRECFHTSNEPLWPLEKKVIYVDQFAISNMMKALNTAVESHTRTAADPFWLQLFEALERVCKLQLAICPYSDGHRDESLVSAYFEPLKRLYEQLSHGVSFDSPEQIAQRQLATAALAWMRGETPEFDLSPERVTSGRLNDWHDRIIITVDMTYPAEMVEGIRSIRDRVHEGVLNVFEHYKGSTGTDFDHWLDHELAAGGEAMIQARALYERRLYEMAQRGEFSWEGIYRSNGLDRFNLLMEVLGKGTGHTPDSLLGRLREFLTSSAFRDAPSNRIEALMWAVIAHRAANGQRRPPNRGMINDISVVSSLLPYCDAMFIDNECRGLLANIPVRHRPTYATRLFSRNNSDDFLSYLREIETNADSAILACVRSVYGDDWPKPYLTIYEETRRGRG